MIYYQKIISKNKIENYKKQDRLAKRKIHKDNYINIKWLMSNIGSCCVECNECLEIEVVDDKILTSLTADRINLDLTIIQITFNLCVQIVIVKRVIEYVASKLLSNNI